MVKEEKSENRPPDQDRLSVRDDSADTVASEMSISIAGDVASKDTNCIMTIALHKSQSHVS